MKVVVSDTPNGPSITHYDLDRLQVCIPVSWSNTQAIQFAESKWPCITNHHWTVRLNGTSQQACDLHEGFKHLNLIMQRDGEADGQIASEPLDNVSSIHARVIINLEGSSDNINRTAESIELLRQYLRVKADALKARQNQLLDLARQHEMLAEQLHSRLLAQFEGTLIFV